MSRHKHEAHSEPGGAPPPAAAEPFSVGPSPERPAATPSSSVPPAASEADSISAELGKVGAELAAARSELAELNDKYLRKLAEEVNFRKRMMREKEDALKYGVSGLLSDLIPVMDDFDRAIASAEQSASYQTLHDGIVLIRRQMGQMLENRYYLRKVESSGALFDPNLHEAVAAAPSDVEEATVGEEFLPGYMLHDRVLRTAKVRVRLPSPKTESMNQGE